MLTARCVRIVRENVPIFRVDSIFMISDELWNVRRLILYDVVQDEVIFFMVFLMEFVCLMHQALVCGLLNLN